MVSSLALTARLVAAAVLLAAPALAAAAENAPLVTDLADISAKPAEPRAAPPAPTTTPDWLRRPTRQQVAMRYPERALRLEAEGRVTMDCVAGETGEMKTCTVTSETPGNLGFAEAALNLGRLYQLRPVSMGGASPAGTKVTIDIPFQLR